MRIGLDTQTLARCRTRGAPLYSAQLLEDTRCTETRRKAAMALRGLASNVLSRSSQLGQPEMILGQLRAERLFRRFELCTSLGILPA